jgi:hypothetical protein
MTVKKSKIRVSEAVRAICKALANDEKSLTILANEVYGAGTEIRRKHGQRKLRKGSKRKAKTTSR